MILQQLAKDADHLVRELPPPMYDWIPVAWIVHLDRAGHCQGIDPTSGEGGSRDRGKRRLVPFRKRAFGIRPILLADKPAYTWGVPEDRPRSAQEHAAYLDLLQRCARETGNPDVRVVLSFLQNWKERVHTLREIEEMGESDLITFAVDGRFPVDAEEVRRFWAREAGGEEDAGLRGQCLVCGETTRVVERLPVSVKGIPKGQAAGVQLVSANCSAFESYGRQAGLTSPICATCGERFGKATNALLKDDHRHLNIGPVAYLFWAPESDWDPVQLFKDPRPEDVRELLRSASSGAPPGDGGRDSAFYATAVSAANSRAVFRSWLHTTVATARRHLARWFELQQLVDATGAPGRPLSIFSLARSLYRKADDIVARVPEVLLRCALEGGPLPDWLLLQAVRRNQVERAVTHPRAALIKTVLGSQQKGDPRTMEQLDPSNRHPAYLCGRLLAELEAIQRVAVNPQATLVDRYYGTASSAPASVFGTLLRTAQAHLGRLRKTRFGAYRRLQQELEQILAGLESWPRVLQLHEQALFALGYYHQRAENRRAALEALERKASPEEAPLELADDKVPDDEGEEKR